MIELVEDQRVDIRCVQMQGGDAPRSLCTQLGECQVGLDPPPFVPHYVWRCS
jgi:hypothetical protein